MKRPRNTKIGGKVVQLTGNNAQKVKGQARLLLRLKGRLRNFKTGTLIEHALYQLPWPAIKGLWSWILARDRSHTVSAASGGHAACLR